MNEKNLNEYIANRIRYYLQQQNKSQQELAEYMEVSQATVSNWCNGIKIPRMNKIDKIVDFFGVRRSDLMGLEDKPQSENHTRRIELPDGLVIAAHHDNDNNFTDEEWDSIIRFVEFVKSKEKK